MRAPDMFVLPCVAEVFQIFDDDRRIFYCGVAEAGINDGAEGVG